MYVHKAAGEETEPVPRKTNRGESKIGINRERSERELVTAASCWCEKKKIPCP